MIIYEPIYDGSLIKQRFAYRFFKKHVSPVGNIVAFRAPMFVSDNLIDLEDSLSKDYIFSDDAVNFCWEIPNLCPFGAVAFQRWFNASIATALASLTNFSKITLDGDDLMVYENFIGSDKVQREYGKASVSITYSKNNVAIGHTGINITAGKKAPAFAFSTNLTDDQATNFMQDVINLFYAMNDDIFIQTSKITLA
jgi:hypothetical protein